jgi:hypothetical protein
MARMLSALRNAMASKATKDFMTGRGFGMAWSEGPAGIKFIDALHTEAECLLYDHGCEWL